VLVAVAMGALAARRDDPRVGAQGNFTTTASVTLSSTAAAANADQTVVLCVPASCPVVQAGEFPLASRTDMNFASVITLLPGGATVAPSPPVAGAGDPLLGEIIGDLAWEASLGATNLSCDSYLPVTFKFMVASADNSAANVVYPSPQNEAIATPGSPGTASEAIGTLMPLLSDTYAITENNGGAPDGGAGIGSAPPVAANGIATHVERYPSYLNTIFSNTPPLARYSGGQNVSDNVMIFNYLIFSPGALAAVSAPDPLYDVAATSLGYSFFSVFQDPTADPAAATITDLCAPLNVAFNIYGTSRGNPCIGVTVAPCHTATGVNNPATGASTGNVRWANPATSGTHYFGALSTSLRDSDSDGYENALDTCPYAINVDNPRDVDGADDDALDPICEATLVGDWEVDCAAGEALPLDDDGDTYVNDGCPTTGGFPESGVAGCANTIDEADEDPGVPVTGDDTAINDGCPGVNVNEDDDFDDDLASNGGVWLNASDNCPQVVNPTQTESERSEPPLVSQPRGGSEADTLGDVCDLAENPNCANSVSNDDDAPPATIGPEDAINDGCPAANAVEGDCAAGEALPLDDDADGFVNDGCAAVGGTEDQAQCGAAVDNDSDGLTNDGCVPVGTAETGCLNRADDEDNPNTAALDGDGAVNDGCPSSSRVGNGHFHSTFELLPVCIGLPDLDGDGWCDLAGTTNGLDDPSDAGDGDTMPCETNGNDPGCAFTPEHYAAVRIFPVASSGSGANPPASGEPRQPCNDGIDNDGNGGMDDLETDGPDAGTVTDCNPASCPGSAPTCVLTAPDTDGDGSSDAVEVYVGTDPLGRCERGSSATSTTPSSDWPMDLAANGAFSADRINVSDLASYVAPTRYIGTSPGIPPFDKRWDVSPGTTFSTWINVADLAVISQTAPIPMFGVRAFGGPTCTASPTLGD